MSERQRANHQHSAHLSRRPSQALANATASRSEVVAPVSALLNVVDVEATCWDGDPPDGQVNEIIEIGLTVVDLDAGRRIGRHSILVRPAHSTVSPFCTELTSLTQADVDIGIPFTDACALLVRDHESRERPWASWGDYDRHQFRRECDAGNVPYPFGEHHTNAKAVFADHHGLRKRPGMAQALALAGLPLEGRHHRGDDDSWNIAALILQLNTGGNWT